jgi:YhcH/YjgK/YiaL family protein
LYEGLDAKIAFALAYLQNKPIAEMEPGTYEIQGKELILLIQHFQSRLLSDGFWEAHRNYTDIQYVIEGTEKMGYAHVGNLSLIEDHLDEKDYKVLEGNGDFLTVNAGSFVIFYPEDAHMPCLAVEQPSPVKKAVFKILL